MNETYRTKERIVRLLLLLAERPDTFTIKMLAEKYSVSNDTIKGDLQILKNIGFALDYNKSTYCYTLQTNDSYKQLKSLLHFTEEDQLLLERAIDQVSPHTRQGANLKKKLSSLYDYRQLGHSYLRKPYLNKVDALLKAKEEQKRVILKNYRSSSGNTVSDRKIEPFNIDPAIDTLQAFDVDKKSLKHFRISRFSRVEILMEDWKYSTLHHVQRTDPFRIVDDNQVAVCLRIKEGARNELIERFPKTAGKIIEDGDGIYDFHCNVNHRFIGLTNFILGFHHQLVDVVFPESLKEHLNETVQKMKF